jgi:hypothetical protein
MRARCIDVLADDISRCEVYRRLWRPAPDVRPWWSRVWAVVRGWV